MAMFKNVKRCPYCFNEQIKIVETRDKKGTTYRRRECLICGKQFKTLEIAEDDLEKIMSNEFLYSKILELERAKSQLLQEVVNG